MYIKEKTPVTAASHTEDYSRILRMRNLKYKEVDQYYLQVGTIKGVQGWILHISVIKTQITQMLNVVVPELVKEKVGFKVINSLTNAKLLLDGMLNYSQTGKIVCIYPENDERAIYLAKKIVSLTLPFRGPAIPTDTHLGGTVYARYGSFNPIIQCDKTGKSDKFIYDYKGQLVKDEYSIPFKMPKGITWPFNGIALPANVESNTMNNAYLITSVIKPDAKGKVFKALRIKGLSFKSCLIKEAKHDMYTDDHNRDIQDRLLWQYTLQKELGKKLPLPEVYELFKENGNTYLAMEFVKGVSLHKVISNIHENHGWLCLELSKKLLLLEYLTQLLNIIGILHELGFVHRDITPTNFILDKHDRLVMIDLELTYNFSKNLPSPSFASGTNGFTSPEQAINKAPTIKEDIYSIGAIIIVFLTDIYPEKFGTGHLKQLEENLNFLIEDEIIIDLIIRCMQPDPEDRPELLEIKETMQHYHNSLSRQAAHTELRVYGKADPDKIQQLINESIPVLDSPVMVEPGKTWHSNFIETEQLVGNIQIGRSYYIGIHSGISGVLYMLAKAKGADIPIYKAMPAYTRNYKYLQHVFIPVLSDVSPGLYSGAAGIALFLAEGLESGLLGSSRETQTAIKRCLQLPCSGPDIANGAAGQGLAILQCLPYLEEDVAKALLQQNITFLLASQQRDGSWINDDKQRTGFSYGVSGIIIFLMEYYHQFKDDHVKSAALKGLEWLRRKAGKRKGNPIWLISNKDKTTSPWLHEGFTGIALCFIRAYELFKDPVYQQLAEGALHNHPHHLVCGSLSLAEGMCGIGEVYLEAAEVFEKEEWQERADWIANVIAHTSYYQPDGTRYWVVEDNKIPTADFMVGNSGVIHFLMRYNMPDKFSFPLLPG